jgi:hypothetical protein
MGMEYFHCYHSYLRRTKNLTDEELGRLFRALMTYSATGERMQIDGREQTAFDFIIDDIDAAAARYEETCKRNQENGRRGGRPRKRTEPTETEPNPEKPGGFANYDKKPSGFVNGDKEPRGYSQGDYKPGGFDTDAEELDEASGFDENPDKPNRTERFGEEPEKASAYAGNPDKPNAGDGFYTEPTESETNPTEPTETEQNPEKPSGFLENRPKPNRTQKSQGRRTKDERRRSKVSIPSAPSYDGKANALEDWRRWQEYFEDAVNLSALEAKYPADEETLRGMVDILVETMCSSEPMIRVGGEDKPCEIVRSRLMKLEYEHLEYALQCMKESSHSVGNMRQYMLTTLYNASITMAAARYTSGGSRG